MARRERERERLDATVNSLEKSFERLQTFLRLTIFELVERLKYYGGVCREMNVVETTVSYRTPAIVGNECRICVNREHCSSLEIGSSRASVLNG